MNTDNIKNVEFLQDAIKYLGFEPKLGLEMAKKMQAGEEKFTLSDTAEHMKDKMSATLHFSKGTDSEMYFLNNFQAKLTKEDGTTKEQTFYVNKNSGVTFKEAYNLLSGRAVHKTLQNKVKEKYDAWVQLDFGEKDKHDNYKVKKFTEGYGFDLVDTVNKYPIKELATEDQRDKLMYSLQKGNAQSVTFVEDGKEERRYVTANPQYKTLNVYDGDMKKIYQEREKKEAIVNEPGTELKKGNKREQTVGSVLNAKRKDKTPGKSMRR